MRSMPEIGTSCPKNPGGEVGMHDIPVTGLMGAQMEASTRTCLDRMFSLRKVTRLCNNLGIKHWKLAVNIVQCMIRPMDARPTYVR